MSARAHILAVANDRFGKAHPELLDFTVAELQLLRTNLLADGNFGPFYLREQSLGGGPFPEAMSWLEAKIVALGGSLT